MDLTSPKHEDSNPADLVFKPNEMSGEAIWKFSDFCRVLYPTFLNKLGLGQTIVGKVISSKRFNPRVDFFVWLWLTDL